MRIPAVDVPEGKCGDFQVMKFKVDDFDAYTYNLQIPDDTMAIVPGNYTRLVDVSKAILVMSDTPSERRDHQEFIDAAYGNVLVNGLGLGLCIAPLMANPEVDTVTVVENSEDVMSLMATTYIKRYPERLNIVLADAYMYKPRVLPDVVWNDIWYTISDENLPEMDKLEAKYCEAAWCESWCRERCKQFETLAIRSFLQKIERVC